VARHLINRPAPALPPAAAVHLAAIAAAVPGRGRARRAALAELADGLTDAVDHYRSQGLTLEAAAATAVRECGPADVVAAAFERALEPRRARQTALTLLATGPAIGVLWLITLVPGQRPDALLLGHPALGAIVIVVIAASLTVVAMTGPGSRWMPCLRLDPRRIAAFACAGAALCDVLVLATAGVAVLSHETALPWMPGVLAAAASLTRFTVTQQVARRGLRPAAV
jgi:hypothetical protein